MKINWKGIGGSLLSILGLVSSPQVMHILPPQYATALTLAGIVAQSVTRPVHEGIVGAKGETAQ